MVFLCLQYRYEQGIALRDLSHETNDQPTKYPTDYRKFRYGKMLPRRLRG